MKNAILIAGPTASGKSALALRLARETGGTIVNADSMQVYSVLRVLTARPDDGDLAAAPHRLYGHVHPSEPYSTGQWMRDVAAVLGDADTALPAIFVGGTGLYFRALLRGLSRMPDVPDDIRRHWRARLVEEGSASLHALLSARDPAASRAIRPSDGQRIVRALEVLDASGRPISEWQREEGTPLVDGATARKYVIEPLREVLVQRIEQRFDRMMEEGAMDEARAMGDLSLDPAQPAMKAIGVRELLLADRGEIGLDEAIAQAKATTRRYSKRQSTWFRTQLGEGWLKLTST